MEATKEQNLKRAKRRLYNKIKSALNKYKCIFLTLSFNDETLKRTNKATRERYIKQYLKNETAFYIANKDYGKKGKREHYHAFIIATTLNADDLKTDEAKRLKNQINLKAYKYGNIKAQFIATRYQIKGEHNKEATAQNITNHFYKETAKNSRIITSRNIPTKAQQIERIKRLIKAKNTDKKQLNDDEIIKQQLKALNEALSDYKPIKQHYIKA